MSHQSYIDTLERKWSKLTDNIKAEKLPEFLRYYWNAQHKRIKANEVFKTIRKNVKTATEVFRLVDEMVKYSEIYMALTDASDEMWIDPTVRENVSLLNLFNLKQPYSLLMAAKMSLNDDQFRDLLRTVIVICFRYNVIGDRNPNDQDIPFNNMSILISSEGRVDYSILTPIIVNDAEFKGAFSEKSFPYSSRNAKVVRYILGKIEHFKGSHQLVSFSDENASIEHVLPQDPGTEWNIDEDKAQRFVFKLGNTCLLERKLNRDLQNVGFSVKKEVYSTSNYYYAKRIASEYEEWTTQSIINLQKEMANAAVSIWQIPNVR